jgi:hypothetical protein
MKFTRLERTCLLIGAGLLLLAFVAMNVRPFAFGDMRVFDWIGVNTILTLIGVAMIAGVGITNFRRRVRRDPV